MSDQNDSKDRLVQGYHRLLELSKEALQRAEKETLPQLKTLLEDAKTASVKLGELTQSEAEKIGAYLKRDLEEAAQSMRETRKELAPWLRFDIDLIEERMLEAFTKVVDHTRVELAQWQRPRSDEDAEPSTEDETTKRTTWHTGEVAGIGTLQCPECGRTLQYRKPGRVPPCPGCRGTTFTRVNDNASSG